MESAIFDTSAEDLNSTDLDQQFNSFLDAWLVDPPSAIAHNVGDERVNDPFAQPRQASDLFTSGVAQAITRDSEHIRIPMNQALSFTGMPMATVADEVTLEAQSSGKGSRNSDDSHGFSGMEEGRSASAADERLSKKTKILEKNRRAQKKFREKQKSKMSELEAQVQAMASSLENMSVEKTCLERQNEVLQKVLELRQSQIDVLTEQARITESYEETAEHFARIKELSTRVQDGITVEQCRRLSGSDAVARWKQFVEQLATLLIEAEMPEPAPYALDRLTAMAQSAGSFAETLAVVNPMAVKILIVSNLETEAWDEDKRIDSEFWKGIVEAIMLTDDQKHKIVCLAQILTRSITRLGDERARLGAELQQHLPGTYQNQRSLGCCIRSQEAMNKLRKNFQSEHGVWTSFVATVLSRVLTPLQFARFCARSYPLFPNTFQVAKCIASSGFVSSCSTPSDMSAFIQIQEAVQQR